MNVSEEEYEEIWQSRMREIQGAIIIASLFEVVIGLTGIIGFLLRWITPLVIAPTVALVGLSLFEEAAGTMSGNWGIAVLSFLLVTLFSQFLRGVKIPRPSYTKDEGLQWKMFPLFEMFPVLLTFLIVWCLCAILTAANVFSQGSRARTDLRLEILHESPWFRFPYPGQWGLPTISAGATFGILAGILSSTVESIGDYYACARLAGAPPPPLHAINRGIFVEGFTCVLAGLWGSGSALTSYSENIGVIGITKVGSRRVVQFGGIIMMFLATLGKFGSLFVTIPEPIVGGICCVMFSMVAAVGISNLQYVDLNSTRNLFVLGVSLFLGLLIPKWLKNNPNAIETGSESADQIITVLLSTYMFVGGFIGILFDNFIPGTPEERGLVKYDQEHFQESQKLNVIESTESNLYENTKGLRCYELPFGREFIRKYRLFKFIPICPAYNMNIPGIDTLRRLSHRKSKDDQ